MTWVDEFYARKPWLVPHYKPMRNFMNPFGTWYYVSHLTDSGAFHLLDRRKGWANDNMKKNYYRKKGWQ